MLTPPPGPAPVAPAYDYAGHDEATRKWLKEQVGAVKAISRRVAADMIQLGLRFQEVRSRIGHGNWTRWVGGETAIHAGTARRLIQVAEQFGALVHTAHAARFEPTALYTLAADRVPAEVREYAVEEARRGVEVTAAVARGWIADHRQWAAGSGRVTAAESPPEEPAPAEATPEHLAFAGIASVLEAGGSVHLTGDADEETGETVYVGRVYPAGEGAEIRYGCRPSVLGLLDALAGREKEKRCGGPCNRWLSPAAFHANRNKPDGRHHWCKRCCSGPQAAAKRAKRAARKVTAIQACGPV